MAEIELQINEKAEEKIDVEEIIDSEKRRFKHFLFMFSGQQLSLLGSSIVSFAIIWWLTITTQSELMLGIASLVSLGPYVIAAPISGLLADKYNRKMLLIIIDACQAVLTVIMSILFITNNITVAIVLVILGLRGTAQAFHTPISMAVTPTMVPQKHLSRMNGLSYLFSGLVNIVGPVIGAALLAIPGINIGMVLWIDVGTFAIAVIPMIFIKIPNVQKQVESTEKPSMFREISEGFRTLNETKGMLALLFAAMMVNFFMSPLLGLLSLFINKTHGGTEVDYAIVVGMLQAAIVVGGLIMSFIKGAKKPVLFFLFSILFQVVCQISLTFIPVTFNGRFWTIGSILFLFALPFAVLDVTFITTIQLMVPKEKLGRVIATIMAISPAIRPLGQFLAGVIAEFAGINIVLIVSAVLSISSLLAIYFFTPLRKLDKKVTEILTKTYDRNKESITYEEVIIEDVKDKSIVAITAHEQVAIE